MVTMARLHQYNDARRLATQMTPGGFSRILDEVIERAAVDPQAVVAAAERAGIPTRGDEPWERLSSLRFHHPARLDALARSFVRSDTYKAGGAGFAANVGGFAAWAVTLPADTFLGLFWLVRATSEVMGSFGFESRSPEGAAQLRLGLLAATGVSRVEFEGQQIPLGLMAQYALTAPTGQRLLFAALRRLAMKVGVNAGKGRAAKAIPLAGGLFGGALNAGAVATFGRRARRHYAQQLIAWQAAHEIDHGVRGALPTPAPKALPSGDEGSVRPSDGGSEPDY